MRDSFLMSGGILFSIWDRYVARSRLFDLVSMLRRASAILTRGSAWRASARIQRSLISGSFFFERI